MNSQLHEESELIEKLIDLFLSVKPEMYHRILLPLQTGSSLQAVRNAMTYEERVKSGHPLPPSALCKIQGNLTEEEWMEAKNCSDFKAIRNWSQFVYYKMHDFEEFQAYLLRNSYFDCEKEMEGWINYFGVYRNRKGLQQFNRILKYQKNSSELIVQTLIGLERLKIGRINRFDKNQVSCLVEIVNNSHAIEVKIQACKTLWAISQDQNNEELKTLFLRELSSAEEIPHILTLIYLLGNYTYSNSEISLQTAKTLRNFLINKNREIVFQAVLSISRTDDTQGLLECLKLLGGSSWGKYKEYDGFDTIHKAGSFLMFRQRPNEIHDNRHAIECRILDRLAQLESKSFSFKATTVLF